VSLVHGKAGRKEAKADVGKQSTRKRKKTVLRQCILGVVAPILPKYFVIKLSLEA